MTDQHLTRIRQFSIELTNVCNEDCTFCATQFISRRNGVMDFDLAKRLIKEVSDTGFCDVVTTNVMGEPTLYKQLIELVEYANSVNQRIQIITNGERLDEEMATRLLRLNPYAVGLSFHATDAESFKFKRSRLPFETYRERAFGFIDLKFQLKATTHITFNVLSTRFQRPEQFTIADSRDKLDRFAQEIFAFTRSVKKKHGLVWPVPEIFTHGNQMLLPGVSFLVHDGYHTWSNDIIPHDATVVPRSRFCAQPFEQFNVLWNGDVVLCCIDYNGELVYDNVIGKSILEVFNNEKMQTLRRAFLTNGAIPKKCQVCLGDVVNKSDGQPYQYPGETPVVSAADLMKKNVHRVVRTLYNGKTVDVIKDQFFGTKLGSKVHELVAGRPYEENEDKRNIA